MQETPYKGLPWHFLYSKYLNITGDPLHSRAACTQPCNVNSHSRAHCSPGARLCEQWGHGCVNNGARLCASARLCRGSPVNIGFNSSPPAASLCVGELGHHWFRKLLGACSAPSLYLNQCWFIVHWTLGNQLQLTWNSNGNAKRFIHKSGFETFAKWHPFCPGKDEC